MSDFSLVQEKLKEVINEILNCDDYDLVVDYMPIYNNYFRQFTEVINDNNGELTQKERELVAEVLDLNKKLRIYFENKKNELERIISKKGLKRKILNVYNPYFKGDSFLKDV